LFTDIAKLIYHTLDILAVLGQCFISKMCTVKNAMQPHLILHQQSPLKRHHFETWLKYFNESVDEFLKEKAFLAKERALSIATVMK
jgi:truncated hemoglobin YjbI